MSKGRKRKGTRTGFTTGACAAAAARAAALGLVTGRVPDTVACLLPNGVTVRFPVKSGNCDQGRAHAVVVKDAGDDPDVTDGARLTADLRLLQHAPGLLTLEGGPGVGRVTLPGLGLDVGGPAINPVPRRSIMDNVRAVADTLLARAGVEVTISVPGGEEMATKTLNPRLGILGGISILGTTGIVYPYSTASFRATVVQGIRVAAAQGQETLVLATGRRTEKFAMRELPHLDPVCFVQMGDFVGAAVDTAVEVAMRHLIIAGMVGKLTKIAQGETMTHAGRADLDKGLLAELAGELGAPAETCDRIRTAPTARFAADSMEALGLLVAFHDALARRVVATLSERYPGRFGLEVLVCDAGGNRIAHARGDQILA